ncbi:MAG TPA: polyamine ABC transporter substrate-binding protein, partial [Pusillimonas sp.]|nr:polyamine ABC transporter substrate-binding protein [Pusillimonas sp.]
MRLKGLLWLSVFCVCVSGVQPAHAQQRVVNVYNWAEYTAPDTLP